MDNKILIYTPLIPPEFAGAGNRAFNHAKYMANRGEKISVLTTTSTNSDNIPNMSILNIKLPNWYKKEERVYRILRYIYSPLLFIKILMILRKSDFEIIHCIPGFSNIPLFIALACKFYNKKVIMETTLLGTDDPVTVSKGLFGKLKAKIFRKVEKIVSISPLLDNCCEKAEINRSNRLLIPNSVDIHKFKPVEGDKNVFRREFGLENFKNVFIYVGMLRPRKGVKNIIKIFNDVKEEIANSCLVLAGPIEKDQENIDYTGELKKLVKDYHIEDRVLFTGEVDNVEKWMQVSDVFMFASEREGFGTVLIEAMSTGLPVISMEIKGITDYIINSQDNGIIAKDRVGFVEELKKVISDDDYYQFLSKNARNTVIDRFSNEKVMKEYFDLYNRLLEKDKKVLF